MEIEHRVRYHHVRTSSDFPHGALRTDAPVIVIALGPEIARQFAADRHRGAQQGGCEGAVARAVGGRVVNTGGDVRVGRTEIELKTARPEDRDVPCVFTRDGSMMHHAAGGRAYATLKGVFAMMANHLPLTSQRDTSLTPDITLRSGREASNATLRRLCHAYRDVAQAPSYRQRMITSAMRAADTAEGVLTRAAADVVQSKNDSMRSSPDTDRAFCGFLELHERVREAYALRGPTGHREYGRLVLVQDADALERFVDPSSVRYTNGTLKFSVRTGARVVTHARDSVGERVTRSLIYMNRAMGVKRAILQPRSDQIAYMDGPRDMLAHAQRFLGDLIRVRVGARRAAVEMRDIPDSMTPGLDFGDVLRGNRERWVEGILPIDHPMLEATLDGTASHADTPTGTPSTFFGEYMGALSDRVKPSRDSAV